MFPFPIQALLALAIALLLALKTVAQASETRLLTRGDLFVDTQTRAVVHAGDRTWEYGVIPVWIDPDLPKPSAAAARRAMAVWTASTGISFIEWTELTPPSGDYVHIQSGSGCASWVGRRGGAQELWVALECSGGSIIHELGHVIGLEHEHTRPDRDAYIQIHWDNIVEDKRHNFDVAPSGSELFGDYDYASIMHYGSDFFSRNGMDTIEPVFAGAAIGQRIAPSAGDVAAVAALYGTDLNVSAELYAGSETGVFELDVRVSNEGLNGAHGLEFDVSLDDGLRIVNSGVSTEAWSCGTSGVYAGTEQATAVVRCRLQKLAAGHASHVRLDVQVMSDEVLRQSDAREQQAQAISIDLQAATDELMPDNNQWVGGQDAAAMLSEALFADDANASEATELDVVNPFAVEVSAEDPWNGVWQSAAQPVLDDGADVGGGGRPHPVTIAYLLLLVAWRVCRQWSLRRPWDGGAGGGRPAIDGR